MVTGRGIDFGPASGWRARVILAGPAGRVAAGVLTAALAGAAIYWAAGGPLPHAVNTGPFGSGNHALLAQCMVAGHTTGVFTVGDIAFQDTGSGAVIDKVGLRAPRRVVLLAAYVLPITGHDSFGSGPGYPSSAMDAAGVHWAQRQRASGARIPHSPDLPAGANLVLVLKLLGKKSGTSDGIDIYYHSSGQNYHFFETIRLTLIAAWQLPCK